MQISAWEAGLDGAAIPDLTPSEAHGYFTASGARTRHQAADADRLAWLCGSYTGTAVNAPKRYPKKPRNAEKILGANKPRIMTDDEMKSFAFAFAKRWNDGNQFGNASDSIRGAG